MDTDELRSLVVKLVRALRRIDRCTYELFVRERIDLDPPMWVTVDGKPVLSTEPDPPVPDDGAVDRLIAELPRWRLSAWLSEAAVYVAGSV